MYFDSRDPPITAMIVAAAWPAVAPAHTATGFWAAPRAMVASMDRSPHSATKIRENDSTRAPHTLVVDLLLSVSTNSSADASSPVASSPGAQAALQGSRPVKFYCTNPRNRHEKNDCGFKDSIWCLHSNHHSSMCPTAHISYQTGLG